MAFRHTSDMGFADFIFNGWWVGSRKINSRSRSRDANKYGMNFMRTLLLRLWAVLCYALLVLMPLKVPVDFQNHVSLEFANVAHYRTLRKGKSDTEATLKVFNMLHWKDRPRHAQRGSRR
jgi:hypothetical protein